MNDRYTNLMRRVIKSQKDGRGLEQKEAKETKVWVSRLNWAWTAAS